jgi:hypothetical protein
MTLSRSVARRRVSRTRAGDAAQTGLGHFRRRLWCRRFLTASTATAARPDPSPGRVAPGRWDGDAHRHRWRRGVRVVPVHARNTTTHPVRICRRRHSGRPVHHRSPRVCRWAKPLLRAAISHQAGTTSRATDPRKMTTFSCATRSATVTMGKPQGNRPRGPAPVPAVSCPQLRVHLRLLRPRPPAMSRCGQPPQRAPSNGACT